MSLMRLKNATTLTSGVTPYFERVRYWVDKQQMLVVAMEDLAGLASAYINAGKDAPKYDLDPRISLPDPRAGLRLALTVEAVCSCVYAMTEIAANFANHLSQVGSPEGQIRGSFNRIKRITREGKFPRLTAALGDLTWHDNLHAMRTEWSHFSTIFIGIDQEQPVVCGAALRAPSDRTVLKSKFQFRLDEIRTLAIASLLSLDAFAAYLLPLVVGKFDLSATIMVPVLDRNGAIRFTENLLVEVKQTTIRERFVELGLGDLCAQAEAKAVALPGSPAESDDSAE
jgi:hypothetical protein